MNPRKSWRGHLARCLVITSLITLPAQAQLDSNGNGMSDVWERHFNDGALFDPENPDHHPHADSDGDGWTNLIESFAGTNPFDSKPPEGIVPAYVVHLKDQEEAPSAEYPEGRLIDLAIISWDTIPGKKYTLTHSADLTANSWVAADFPHYGEGDPIAVTITLNQTGGIAPGKFFWRVAIEDTDSDSDSLTDHEEFLLGLNPFKPSTHAGIPDLWVAVNFPTTSTTFDPFVSPHGNGISNLDAYQFGLDPNVAHSIGLANPALLKPIADSPDLSFREEHPSDLYHHDSVTGWSAATGEYIEIWEEEDGDTYMELQAHWGSHGVTQEFDMLPGTVVSFTLRYKGRYEWSGPYENAFDLIVEGADEVRVNGVPIEPAGITISHAFMEDDTLEKYNEWHFAVVSIHLSASAEPTGLVPVTISLVPKNTSSTEQYSENDITHGGFVSILPHSLVVDADNTTGYRTPSATTARLELREWPGEEPHDPAYPGKILFVNSGDEDGDGIPDFADGLDIFATDGFRYPQTAPDRSESARMVPFVLTLSTPYQDLGELPLRFQYAASDPAAIQRTGPEDAYKYEAAPGTLRIWKRNSSGHQFGDEEDPSPIRSVMPVDVGGDYIPPETTITAADLGFSEERDSVILYLESLVAGEELRDQTVLVEVDYAPPGSDPDFLPIGRLECTSIDIGLVRVQADNSTTAVNAIQASSPVPDLQVTQVGIQNLSPSQDSSEITATLHIAGNVGSFFADITPPSGGGVFQEVQLYLNGSEEPVATIPVTGTKTADASSHLRPYPFEGTFSDTLPDMPVIEGANEITVVAIDPIDGVEARSVHSIEILAISPHADIDGGAGADVLATLILELTGPLDPEVSEIITASLSTPEGAVVEIELEETGDSTREFTDTDQEFTIHIHHGGENADANAKDLLIATAVHDTLCSGGLRFGALVETGVDTHVFSQHLIDDSSYWLSEDYDDFTFQHGPVIHAVASNPGIVHPYMLRLYGPEDLLAFIDEVITADGPRKVEKSSIDGFYYVKMKNSRPAINLFKMVRELTFGDYDSNEERILAFLDMIASGLSDELQYQIGIAHGMWDGGADMVEGLYQLAKFALVDYQLKWRAETLIIRALNGDKFESEKKFASATYNTMKTLHELHMLLRGEQYSFGEALITSLIAGDNEAINAHVEALGDKYGDSLIAAAEILEAIAKDVENLTPRQQGYFTGRASFEILTLYVSWTKLGKVLKLTKANFLKELEKLPFFKTGPGKAAFDKLLAQGDYLARLAGTKMCFPPGTPIATADGPVAIEHIRPDDLVWSRCKESGVVALKPVVQLFTTHPDQLYHLTISTEGSAGVPPAFSQFAPNITTTSILSTTATHPFWVIEKRAFIPAAELQYGDTFLTLDGHTATLLNTSIEKATPGASFDTHNFEVADFHTYFAGQAEVWVHNSGNACQHLFSLYDRFRRLNQKTPEEAWRLMEKMYVGHLDQSGILQVGPRAGKYSDVALGDALEEVLRKDVFMDPNLKLWTKGPKKTPGHNMFRHYVEHVLENKSGIPGGEFPNITNAVDYVKAARSFAISTGDDVVIWTNQGKKFILHKTDGRFTIEQINTGELRTFFRANPKGGTLYDWAIDPRRGYTGEPF